ncbi:MAG: hypothetical protein KGL48_15110 [Sphingomonadales bacterium]|nr:hypothetical protein [Sphingomonadales bacterium]MDE2567603.1 hypothetical protein [Sphingomonadales bacterium]
MSTERTWQTYDHYVYGAVATLGTFAAIGLITWLMTSPLWQGSIPHLTRTTGPFLNVLGVLFGLTLAFLANDTWTAHDRARGAVLQE